jgi:hypothetical protein
MFNIKTLPYMRGCLKHPNVPPELYNLTDLLIGDVECACEVAQGMKAKLNIEGQKYLTSPMVIPIIEPFSPDTQATNGHWHFQIYVIQIPWKITKTEKLLYFD